MKKIVEYLKFVFFILIFVLLVSNLMLLKNIMNTLVKIDEEIKIKTENLETKIEEVTNELFEKQEIISEMIFSTYENTNFQIKQFQNINETYGNVLEETKKEINHKLDEGYNEIPKIKEAGLYFYDNKNYLEAYNKFKNILLFEEDNHEIRNMLVKSLYYSNPANSTNFTEIMNEINKIKNTVYNDAEIKKIENIIKLERGEIDE